MRGGDFGRDTLPRVLVPQSGIGAAKFNRVWIKKPDIGADEFEFATGELLPAIIRKILDERVLARHHLREIEAYVFGADAPWPGVAGQVDRKSTRLNSSHRCISYAAFCLKK